jgi:hypothetical protein
MACCRMPERALASVYCSLCVQAAGLPWWHQCIPVQTACCGVQASAEGGAGGVCAAGGSMPLVHSRFGAILSSCFIARYPIDGLE